jgi:hypothetical protein
MKENDMTPWEIKGTEFVNCNCDYGCPCQFNALPTHGNCIGIGAYTFATGHHGAVRLDGLKAVTVYKWPAAVHEGRGEMLMVIDESASEAQRQSLHRILMGEDTEPGKTVWNVFASTMERFHDPLFAPIEISIDVDARRSRVKAGSLINMTAEPIRNPVTGAEHRARIDLPDGFEYTIAEMGSGTSSVGAPIPIKLESTYAQLAHLHLNQNGVVR